VLAVLLASPVLGLDNFAVSVALALQGIGRGRRAIVVALFGGMAAAAIMLGEIVGGVWLRWLGSLAQYAGGLILISLGTYQLWQNRHAVDTQSPAIADSMRSLFVVAIGVSLDTIVAGVAFGLRGDPILQSAAVVGSVTAALTFVGLELGAYVGNWGTVHGRVAPAVLVGMGVAIAAGVL
jgi:putative Mn2+ efflux pump MntP